MTEDTFKGGIHATMGTLAAVMLAYNAMRWCATRHKRNVVNIVIYAPLVLFEWHHVKAHLSKGSL